MEYEQILNLLNEASDSKFVTRNETLSIIIQIQIMMCEMKLSYRSFKI